MRFGFDGLELRNFNGKSKTKQRGRLMGVSYIAIIGSWSVIHTAGKPILVFYIIHIRGAFSVARFDLPGNAKA